ncbi:MAG: FG-GAP repeat domain-containing protein, partial [Planctomycetota bacterium]
MRHATSRTAAAAAMIVPISHFLAGCGRTESQTTPPDRAASPWFEEVAISRGLEFTHQSGHRARYLMPEIMCGGAALFDMDGDGDLDAYLVQAGSVSEPSDQRPPNQLFENLGDGTFKNATTGSGADDRGYGMGVACGDYDNDGDVDLYVTNLGPNVLLRNDGRPGAPAFTDVTG